LVRVRYKLDGVDSDWVERVNQRSALYSTLAPGKYLLHVKACNNDGVWNESGTSLAFVVRPAWWQSWWFLNSLGAVLVITLVGIVRLVATRKLKLSLARLEQKRAVESERARIARDIHDDLGAGLTQIMFEGALARRHPQKDVQNHLTQISDRAGELIQAMDEIVWAVNPQNDTLESLVNYFSKYIQDFLIGAGIRCRLDIPEVIPARQMSPEVRHNVFLATKEALNNIVKHAQAREVHLKLAFQPERMTILIVDDGVGFAPKTGQVSTIAGRTAPGQGLRNMAGRMETIGGRFVIRSQPGQGTTIEMDIRLGTIAHTNG
jgi:signal transduction histidine kinase